MTIPTLISKYQEKAAVSKLKKHYSTLSQAYKLIEAENGSIHTWFNSNDIAENSKRFFELLKPYLRVSKNCGFEPGCFSTGYLKTLEGQNYVDYDSRDNEYKFILADGTNVMLFLQNPKCINGLCGNIKVDIDGYSGDYAWGRDVFIFEITTKGIIPAGLKDESIYSFDTQCNLGLNNSGNGIGCTAWVIYKGNMDYLHCNDLSWNGKDKCN